MQYTWTPEPRTRVQIEDNRQIVRWYQEQAKLNPEIWGYLTEGADFRPNVLGRGLTPETLQEFRVGYCPSDTPSFPGITLTDSDGETYEPLRERITIPTEDVWGTPVAIAGRRRFDSSSKLKFLSTSISKSHHLYNLNRAKDSIYQKGFAIAMEGQMDVMTMWQYGVYNVVCSQGTGMSVRQLCLLRRYANVILYIPDSDKGGKSSLESLNKTVQKLSAKTYGKFDMYVDVENIPEGYKDVNELSVTSDKEGEAFFDYLKGITLS